MDDLIKKKLEIAKRAGELEAEISSLVDLSLRINKNKESGWNGKKNEPCAEALYVKIEGQYLHTNGDKLSSWNIDPHGSELHDALLLFLSSQIDKRKKELNDLIKIPQ